MQHSSHRSVSGTRGTQPVLIQSDLASGWILSHQHLLVSLVVKWQEDNVVCYENMNGFKKKLTCYALHKSVVSFVGVVSNTCFIYVMLWYVNNGKKLFPVCSLWPLFYIYLKFKYVISGIWEKVKYKMLVHDTEYSVFKKRNVFFCLI
jgi:hypothetical protein